jgi:hypothetical protein
MNVYNLTYSKEKLGSDTPKFSMKEGGGIPLASREKHDEEIGLSRSALIFIMPFIRFLSLLPLQTHGWFSGKVL